MKGTLLLKCLAALCVLECVGAKGVSGLAPTGAGSDTPSTPLPFTDENEALGAFTANLEVVVKGKLNAAELKAVVKLHAAELEGVRGECEDKKAAMGYYMIECGSCGGALISTKSECEAAATALDLSKKTAYDYTSYASPNFPPGCQLSPNGIYVSLYFFGNGSTGSCSSSLQCICKSTSP